MGTFFTGLKIRGVLRVPEDVPLERAKSLLTGDIIEIDIAVAEIDGFNPGYIPVVRLAAPGTLTPTRTVVTDEQLASLREDPQLVEQQAEALERSLSELRKRVGDRRFHLWSLRESFKPVWSLYEDGRPKRPDHYSSTVAMAHLLSRDDSIARTYAESLLEVLDYQRKAISYVSAVNAKIDEFIRSQIP